MVYLLEGYFTVVVEVIILKIFFDTFFKPKSLSNYRTAGIFFLLSGLCFASSALLDQYVFAKIIVVMAITFFCMILYVQGHWRQIATLTLIYQGMLLVTDYIALGLKSVFFNDVDISQVVNALLMAFLAKMALFLFVVILKSVFHQKEFAVLEDKDWIKFMFFPLFTICMVIAMFTGGALELSSRMGELFVIIPVGLVIMNIIMFYLLDDILIRQTNLRNQQLFLLETKNQLRFYESLSQSVTKQRQMAHEYQNQLNIIQMLSEKNEIGELKEYLVRINGELLHDLDYIDAHHVIVNAVLNQKYSECHTKGILFICKINDMGFLQMEEQDIATVLSNLLNNAIEACEKLAHEEKKVIKIKCVLENNMLYLSVRNTFDGQIRKDHTSFVTLKKEDRESHGFGLKNVIHIVEKYGGEYIIQPSDNEFFITICIPNSCG